jgi:hypothetical protein
MFKYYIIKNNIDINQNRDVINTIFQDNVGVNMAMIGYLINETDLKYSYRINKEVYDRLMYNFNISNNEYIVKINNDVMTDYDLRLDQAITGSHYFYVILQKYKKCFLVFSKSLNPPKLNKKDYQSILRYM